MSSGIYKIVNAVNGRVYIGSAVDLKQRWQDHRKTLRGRRHKNPYLQASWNLHSEAAFSFNILYECEISLLIKKEQQEIDTFVEKYGWDQLYNINRFAGSRLGTRHSEETRRKIGQRQLGTKRRVGKFHSEETKRRLSEVLSNPSSETRLKMSLAKLGKKRRPFTIETRQRMSAAAMERESKKRRMREINARTTIEVTHE